MGLLKETGISIKEALEMDCLKKCKLIAGFEGYNNVIYRVNVMADSEILNWVSEDELLLTTAYFFKSVEVKKQLEFIRSLKKKKLAGIAIKIYPYLERLPKEVLELANELKLPIIELDYAIAFTDIMGPIFKKIFNRQGMLLQKVENLHNNLMNIILTGGEVKDIVATLSKILSKPILVSNNYFDEYIYDDKFYPFHYHEITMEIEKLINNNVYNKNLSKTYSSNLNINGETYEIIMVPIILKNSVYGHVIAVAEQKSVTSFDIVSMETGSTIIALEFLKRMSIQDVENRYSAEFFQDIISLDKIRKDKAIERAKYYKFDPQKYFNIINIYFNKKTSGIGNEYDFNQYKDKGIYLINKICKEEGNKYLITNKGDSLIIMFMWNKNKNIKGKIKTLVQKMDKSIKEKMGSIEYSIGIGRPYKGIDNVYKSLKDADKAIEARKTFINDTVIDFDNLGIYKILCHDNLRDELKRFFQSTLLPLCEYDEKRDTELVKTLEVYFQMNGNLKRMSEHLYTHYNTILYRINRICEITKMNLDDEADRFNLETALRIKRIMGI
ncbi:MAG: PucR family transcriptional regulator ligand-binding domain-containing protein [Anaeromicrobium sp.]|jgi:purine catabolism regulator|uniref:PucR family transcriptional regulator n=1 Tax=Anaeromicrobium sp. TaxID=1929132 RepID=UPI0025F5493B|nr:PucR family transcriptional regulator [Anaeromicrobium sp.]MCT4593560.1 PucR family transcriptional regulator ligand-binding domain-containing protein [Anaeromicrobium sp.]